MWFVSVGRETEGEPSWPFSWKFTESLTQQCSVSVSRWLHGGWFAARFNLQTEHGVCRVYQMVVLVCWLGNVSTHDGQMWCLYFFVSLPLRIYIYIYVCACACTRSRSNSPRAMRFPHFYSLDFTSFELSSFFRRPRIHHRAERCVISSGSASSSHRPNFISSTVEAVDLRWSRARRTSDPTQPLDRAICLTCPRLFRALTDRLQPKRGSWTSRDV